MTWRGVACVALGYLLGAFPTGALVGRLRGVDLRQRGSGSTGATNAVRVLGPGAGAVVLAGDAFKGWLAATAGRHWGGVRWAPLAALAALVGHNYSLFLGGRGGKGVATGLGSLLALAPSALALGAVAGVPAIALTRHVSLGSLLGTSTAAAALGGRTLAGRAPATSLAYVVGATALIWYAHRENIARLRAGTERRLGERA
ncbi:MAG: glycerol-3-phosphate acyltransferase [Chloroflexi bacterium]|nr:glycerol-3-phosphate acyltransferase [Chloroflexota bacterium]